MRQLITNPKKFAEWFNRQVPFAYKHMTVADINKLADERLIRKSSGYFHLNTDKLTIIGILNFIKYLDEKDIQETNINVDTTPRCKNCGQVLPPTISGKHGRRREYCHDCESARVRERGRKHRASKRSQSVNSQAFIMAIPYAGATPFNVDNIIYLAPNNVVVKYGV